jgi:release factor glutamine methyltransferase
MPPKKLKKIPANKVAGLLSEAGSLFKAQGLAVPELEAELLLAEALKKDRIFILAHPDFPVPAATSRRFASLVKQRAAGWSSAVLRGTKEFYNLSFKVNRDVLVPRPETEILVDLALSELRLQPIPLVLDIGTGSGAIIVSLAHNFSGYPKLVFAAVDKSAAALRVARTNARQYREPVKFFQGDLLQPVLPLLKRVSPSRLLITANLPYLTPAQLKEPSIKREPRAALLSGADGLWHYKRLFSQLRRSGYHFSLIGEINPEQAPIIEKLARASFSPSNISFPTDYSGRIRFFTLKY